MANDCQTVVCLRGTLPAIKEFEKMCNYEYDMWDPRKCQERHFMRIRDYIGIYDIRPLGMGLYCAYIEMNCAWSANCCMFSGALSYYNDWLERSLKMCKSNQPYMKIDIPFYTNNNYNFKSLCSYGPWEHPTNIRTDSMYFIVPGGPVMCTTLPYECYRLGLDAEVWTEEPGMGFQEHYRIYHGVVVLDECLDMYCEEITVNTTAEELRNKYPNMEIDEEYLGFLRNELVFHGGDWYMDIKHPTDYVIDCFPKQICGHVMCDKI